MKFTLTPKEQQELDSEVKNNPIRTWLQFRENMKFEVGDVLIKSYRRQNRETSEYEWIPETISSSDSKLAQRYVYVYEDDQGIGYLKMLKVSTGTLGSEVFCMTNFDYRGTRFEVDPEYAESQLLDSSYDIRDIHKKSLEGRKIATKMNRKIGKKLIKLSELNTFFDSLAVGDTFWSSGDYTGRYVTEYKVTKLDKVPISLMDKVSGGYSWRNYKEKNKDAVDSSETYRISFPNRYPSGSNSKDEDKYAYEFARGGYVLYKQKPVQEDKK